MNRSCSSPGALLFTEAGRHLPAMAAGVLTDVSIMNSEPCPGTLLPDDMTRRECISTLGIVAGVAAGGLISEAPADAAPGFETVPVEITVNGQKHRFDLDVRVTVLDLLRERMNLTGTRKGCDHGQCGACTVLANGRRINSCLALAVAHDGEEIITVEGIARGPDLHPVQEAFIEHDGFQCGYCTPGQICSAIALLEEAKRGDVSFVTADLKHSGPADLNDDEIRERMSGNLCRCGAYPGIVAAVRAASRQGAAR